MMMRHLFLVVLTAMFGPLAGQSQWQPVLPDEFIWGLDAKGDTLVVGTYDGHLLFSGNGGSTWSERTGNMPSSYIDNVIVLDDDRLICSNGSGVWTSNDWSTWTLRHTLTSNITCLVSKGDTLVVGGEFNAGLSASFNGGASCVSISTGQNQLYSTTAAIIGDSILWGRFGAEAAVSVNGGSTWSPVAGLGTNVFSFSENGQFAGNDVSVFSRSGSGWSESFVNAQILDIEVDGERVAACGPCCGGATQQVFLSLDAGLSWTSIEAPFTTGQISKVALVGSYLYAGADQGLHRLNLDVWAGIDNRNTNGEFLLVPNPAGEQVAIHLGHNKPLLGKIRIVDTCGRTVQSTRTTNMDRPLVDISGLSPGTYWVIVEHGTGSSVRPLIVVR
jgi:hypothetical protein